MKASACSTQEESSEMRILRTNAPTKRPSMKRGAEKNSPGIPVFFPTAYCCQRAPLFAARKYSRCANSHPTKLSLVFALLDAMQTPVASMSQMTSAPRF